MTQTSIVTKTKYLFPKQYTEKIEIKLKNNFDKKQNKK